MNRPLIRLLSLILAPSLVLTSVSGSGFHLPMGTKLESRNPLFDSQALALPAAQSGPTHATVARAVAHDVLPERFESPLREVPWLTEFETIARQLATLYREQQLVVDGESLIGPYLGVALDLENRLSNSDIESERIGFLRQRSQLTAFLKVLIFLADPSHTPGITKISELRHHDYQECVLRIESEDDPLEARVNLFFSKNAPQLRVRFAYRKENTVIPRFEFRLGAFRSRDILVRRLPTTLLGKMSGLHLDILLQPTRRHPHGWFWVEGWRVAAWQSRNKSDAAENEVFSNALSRLAAQAATPSAAPMKFPGSQRKWLQGVLQGWERMKTRLSILHDTYLNPDLPILTLVRHQRTIIVGISMFIVSLLEIFQLGGRLFYLRFSVEMGVIILDQGIKGIMDRYAPQKSHHRDDLSFAMYTVRHKPNRFQQAALWVSIGILGVSLMLPHPPGYGLAFGLVVGGFLSNVSEWLRMGIVTDWVVRIAHREVRFNLAGVAMAAATVVYAVWLGLHFLGFRRPSLGGFPIAQLSTGSAVSSASSLRSHPVKRSAKVAA